MINVKTEAGKRDERAGRVGTTSSREAREDEGAAPLDPDPAEGSGKGLSLDTWQLAASFSARTWEHCGKRQPRSRPS